MCAHSLVVTQLISSKGYPVEDHSVTTVVCVCVCVCCVEVCACVFVVCCVCVCVACTCALACVCVCVCVCFLVCVRECVHLQGRLHSLCSTNPTRTHSRVSTCSCGRETCCVLAARACGLVCNVCATHASLRMAPHMHKAPNSLTGTHTHTHTH